MPIYNPKVQTIQIIENNTNYDMQYPISANSINYMGESDENQEWYSRDKPKIKQNQNIESPSEPTH